MTRFFAHYGDIHTTNAIESINMSLRKFTMNRDSSPNDEAVAKLSCLALNNITNKCTLPIRDWKVALSRFTILRGPDTGPMRGRSYTRNFLHPHVIWRKLK